MGEAKETMALLLYRRSPVDRSEFDRIIDFIRERRTSVCGRSFPWPPSIDISYNI